MKIVYDNIIFSLQKVGGVSLYWREIISRALEKDQVKFYESKNSNLYRKTTSIHVEIERLLPIYLLRYLPFLKAIPGRSIFHSSYLRICLQKDVVNITTVHDFTFEVYGSGFKRYAHIWQKRWAINNSDGIVCVSNSTKKDLINFFPNIDQSKIIVIHNGVSEGFGLIDSSEKKLVGKFKIINNKK